jgi:hypothetical protein
LRNIDVSFGNVSRGRLGRTDNLAGGVRRLHDMRR